MIEIVMILLVARKHSALRSPSPQRGRGVRGEGAKWLHFITNYQ